MSTCNRCGKDISPNDLATGKAHQAKDGRTFCPSCTAYLIAQQKAAKAAAAAQGAPGAAPALPSGRPAQTGRPVGVRPAGPVPANAPRPAAPARPPVPQVQAPVPVEAEPQLSFINRYGGLMVKIGIGIAAIIMIIIWIRSANDSLRKQDETHMLETKRVAADTAINKAFQDSDTDLPTIEAAQKEAQARFDEYQEYAKSINRLEDSTKAIDDLTNLMKPVLERIKDLRDRGEQEQTLLKEMEDLKAKVNNPDQIEAIVKRTDEIAAKGKELQAPPAFFAQVEELAKATREPVIAKLLGDVKNNSSDVESVKAKYLAALKKARELDQTREKEKEKRPTDPPNHYVTDIFGYLKQLGIVKDNADNPHDEWIDLFDGKYTKKWKSFNTDINVEPQTRGGPVIWVPKTSQVGGYCVYYIGDEYAWDELSIDIQFTITEDHSKGFALLGHYNPNDHFGDAWLNDMGEPWKFNCYVNDFGPGVRNTLTLKCEGQMVTVTGPYMDQPKTIDISDPKYAKIGGIGLLFRPIAGDSGVVINYLKIKIPPRR